MKLFLDNFFTELWRGREPFGAVEQLTGEEFRNVKSRRTIRFVIDGRSFFLKFHRGVGWREIFKNLLQGKRPVLGAGNEFAALKCLKEWQIETMTPCAFGERGWNPARLESFLITAELTDCISLEDFCRPWPQEPPPFALKKALIESLARTSRTLHRNGLNHRDYYLCHYLLDRQVLAAGRLRLYLIDLHRAQLRRKTPYRYVVKDVAGLWFSAMDIGLTRRDLLRFMRLYRNRPLRDILQQDAGFWRTVDRTARKLYCKEFRRQPAVGAFDE